MTTTEIREAIREVVQHPGGVVGVMRDEQLAMSRTIVPISSVAPFAVPAWDWAEALVTTDGHHAFIVLVHARRRRRGALRRLVAGIKAAGLKPVVCSPIGWIMPAILEHWQWCRLPGTDDWTEPARLTEPPNPERKTP